MVTKHHRTYHASEPYGGRVAIGCSCGWTDSVYVKNLSWVDAMSLIYRVRDEHEQQAAAYEARL